MGFYIRRGADSIKRGPPRSVRACGLGFRHNVIKADNGDKGEYLLRRLRGFLDDNEPKVALWLSNLWENQQQAITYKEIREAVVKAERYPINSEVWLFNDERLIQWQRDYTDFVNTRLGPLMAEAMTTAGELLKSRYAGFLYEPATPSIAEYVREKGARFVTNSVNEQRSAIAVLIGRAASYDGLTADELSRQIRPLIGLTKQQAEANQKYYTNMFDSLHNDIGISKKKAEARAREASVKYAARQHRFRAMNIARTELAFAYNYGAYDSTKKAQLEGYIGPCVKRWLTAEDERVCEICGGLDDKVIGMDEAFSFPKRRIPYPEFHMMPPAHPSCRCTAVFEEVEAARNQGFADESADVRPDTSSSLTDGFSALSETSNPGRYKDVTRYTPLKMTPLKSYEMDVGISKEAKYNLIKNTNACSKKGYENLDDIKEYASILSAETGMPENEKFHLMPGVHKKLHLPEEASKYLKQAKADSLILTHCHNNTSELSEDDVRLFLKYPSLKIITAAADEQLFSLEKVSGVVYDIGAVLEGLKETDEKTLLFFKENNIRVITQEQYLNIKYTFIKAYYESKTLIFRRW